LLSCWDDDNRQPLYDLSRSSNKAMLRLVGIVLEPRRAAAAA
jgi:hypothetical protein